MRERGGKYYDAAFNTMFGMQSKDAFNKEVGDSSLASIGLGLFKGEGETESIMSRMEKEMADKLLPVLNLSPGAVFKTLDAATGDDPNAFNDPEVKNVLKQLGIDQGTNTQNTSEMKESLNTLVKTLTGEKAESRREFETKSKKENKTTQNP